MQPNYAKFQHPSKSNMKKLEPMVDHIELVDWREYRKGILNLSHKYPGIINEIKNSENGELMLSCFNGMWVVNGGILLIKSEDMPSAIVRQLSGKKGIGTFSTDDTLFYREDIVDRFVWASMDWDGVIEGYNICMHSLLDDNTSFNYRLCVPTVSNKAWSKARVLSRELSFCINTILDELSNGFSFTCSIAKIHMYRDKPVLSFKNKIGTTDYGLTPIILENFEVPIKEVYIIFSEMYGYKIHNAVIKKHSDGEYSLTLY